MPSDETPPDGVVPWVDGDGAEKLIEWREIERTPAEWRKLLGIPEPEPIDWAGIPATIDRLRAAFERTPPADQDTGGPGRRVRVQLELDQRDLAVLASLITDGPDPVSESAFVYALLDSPHLSTWSTLHRILVAVTTADHEILP